MREQGLVIQLEDQNMAQVQFRAGSACEKCGACMLGGSGIALIKAQNEVGAGVGDVVEVDIRPSQVIWASFLIFILPLVALILGYFVGSYISIKLNIGSQQNFGILFAVLLLALSFLGLSFYDRILGKKKKFMCRITGVVKAKER